MKRYWPLLLLALVIAAVVGMSQYAESTKQHCEESASEVKAAAVPKGDDGKTSNNAKDACKPPVWSRYFTWPEGVGAWAVVLTLLVIAWQSIETRAAAQATQSGAEGVDKQLRIMKRQVRLQSVAMQQWIELEPVGIATPSIFQDLIFLTLQFEVMNRTGYLFTIKKISTMAATGLGKPALFTVNPDVPVPLGKGHRFYVKTAVTQKSWDTQGAIFTIVCEITYRNCLGKLRTQRFEDLYMGYPSGNLTLMKSSGIVPDITDPDQGHDQHQNPT